VQALRRRYNFYHNSHAISISEGFLFIKLAATVANEVAQINNLVSEWLVM